MNLNPRSIVIAAVVVLAAGAWPAWRWFTAPALDSPEIKSARPFAGTQLLPVNLEPEANAAPGARPPALEGVSALAPRADALVAIPEKRRKALKKQIDAALEATGVSMDHPTMTRPAGPSALVLNASCRAVPESGGVVAVAMELDVVRKLRIANDGSEPWDCVVWTERRSARVKASDLDQAVVALAQACLAPVIKRWKEENPAR
ncbi:MAG: hypothetical protein ACKO5K_15595 [Armatimonadota bacterium]